jgi:hypothetical protein
MPSTQGGVQIGDAVLYKQVTITDAANAADKTLATVSGSVEIESVVVKSTGATTADLTSIAVKGGASGVVTFIDAVAGLRANIAAADQQVSWIGRVELGNTKTIIMDFTGTGATAVALLATIRYRPITAGSMLT